MAHDRNPETADVIVVGGGVIGLSVARALGMRGIKNVIVIERAQFGSEASSAAAGMLAPQAEADTADEFFRLACKSRDLYSDFTEALRDETGIDIELDQTGTLYVSVSKEDEAESNARYEWQTRAGLSVERLTGNEARLLEPCISDSVRSALRFPLDVQVENRRLVSALVESNQRLSARLIPNTSVNSICVERHSITGVQTSRGFFSAPNVLVAAGAWSSQLTSSAELPNLGMEPVRGQMISLESNPRLARHVIYSPRGYLVPRMDGRLLAGSTSEAGFFEKRVTGAGLYRILSHALEISPAIAKLLMLDCWAGVRPKSRDGLPVLGPYAEIDGLFYATGHYRNGILLAPITGELIADVIVNRVVPTVLVPFVPDRFHSLSVH